MNKKILYLLGVLVVVFAVYKFVVPSPPPEGVRTDNKISAALSKDLIKEDAQQPTKSVIYIDVSGSMKPYFWDEGTPMITAVSSIRNLSANTSVYFIGAKEKQSGYVTDLLRNAYSKGGTNSSSFPQFFRQSIDSLKRNPNAIIYLVTDGISSLGRSGRSMNSFLTEIEGQIRASFSGTSDIACEVLRYTSPFECPDSAHYRYIDSQERPHKTPKGMTRPFYIIAIGSKSVIRWLDAQPKANIGNYEDKLALGTHDFDGHLQPVRIDTCGLEDPSKDITLVLTLPPCLKGIDKKLCKVENNGQPVKEAKLEKANDDPEHIEFTIPSAGLKPTPTNTNIVELTVTAPNKIPEKWLTTYSCDDDTSRTTTYGLSTLIRGIYSGLQQDRELFHAVFIYKL